MNISVLEVDPIGANCYVVNEGNEAFIIDPGGSTGEIISEAKMYNVRYILLTHSHFDHISGLNEISKAFPDAKVCISREEKDFLYDPQLNLSAHFGIGFTYSGKVDIELEDGQSLDFAGKKIKVIITPGHTPGGTCFFIENSVAEGACSLFSGDTLFKSSIGRTDFPGGDSDILVDSIRTKLFTLPGRTMVYPGHEAPTNIAWEKQRNPFVQD